MVNRQKAAGGDSLQQRHSYDAEDSEETDDAFGVGMFSAEPKTYNVQHLKFEMWVSLPDDWDHALHNYTRLQAVRLDAMPLENIRDWRQSFPRLESVIEEWPRTKPCDLIYLDASFRLMDEFPPRHSKLGIGLEVDFEDRPWPGMDDMNDVEESKEWTCLTHMYQGGQLISEPAHEECRTSGRGNVKPFFQSKWWASIFTCLTEARKLAEDSKDPRTVELANERSHEFFGKLTIMQEIFATRNRRGSDNNNPTRRRKPTRMGILLWRF